jgi:hypothetical protein
MIPSEQNRLNPTRASLEVSYKSSGIILPNNIKQKPVSTSSLFRVGTIEVWPGLLS